MYEPIQLNRALSLSPGPSSASSSHRSVVVIDSRDAPYDPSSHSQPNEQLRARELLRYYTPPSPPAVRQTVTVEDQIVPPLELLENAPIGSGSSLLKSSEDPALTAFAQLLALKLDCQRSMISLIDRTKQYVPYATLLQLVRIRRLK